MWCMLGYWHWWSGMNWTTPCPQESGSWWRKDEVVRWFHRWNQCLELPSVLWHWQLDCRKSNDCQKFCSIKNWEGTDLPRFTRLEYDCYKRSWLCVLNVKYRQQWSGVPVPAERSWRSTSGRASHAAVWACQLSVAEQPRDASTQPHVRRNYFPFKQIEMRKESD